MMENFSSQTVISSTTLGTLVTHTGTVIRFVWHCLWAGTDQLWLTLVWRQNDPLSAINAHCQTKTVCRKFQGSLVRKLCTV